MRATFTQDQLDLEKTIRSLAEGERSAARACLDQPWSRSAVDDVLVRDFSVLGVPERAGGVGSSLVDLVIAVEALGELLVPSVFSAHAAAVQLLVDSGVDLTPALDGAVTWVPAVDEAGVAGWGGLSAPVAAPATKSLVPYVAAASSYAVLGSDGVDLVGARASRERESFDPSRPLADVDPEPGTARPVGRGAQRAALVVAAELCGVAQGAIEIAAGHARTRSQFGRVIGSFQGVAFQLADAAVARKAAWDLTIHAAWAVEHDRPEAEAQVHAACWSAGKAAVFAAERSIQVHGGMGITREADPHLYLRRAMVLDASLGSGSWHRRRSGELRVAARA